MKKQSLTLASCLLLAALAATRAAGEPAAAAAAYSGATAVEGLWSYTTLTPPGGEQLDLTGLFLFKDGLFAQQSIFDGEPFEQQMAMAHAGTYEAAPDGVHLVAEETISIAPGEDPPLSSRGITEHELSVTRSGDELTLVFGSGTVQKFERVGEGAGTVYPLADGIVAFVDGYFLLVSGVPERVTSGYGTFEQDGKDYDLRIIRWAETNGPEVSYRRSGTLQATFDGRVFTLADGRSFQITP